MIVGLAGAVCSGDDRARRRFAGLISARGRSRGDRKLLRLTANVAAERPADSAPILTALKPLFDDAGWSEALDRVAPEAVGGMREGLVAASDLWIDAPGEADWILGAVRRDLDLYRPLLGERPELAALDVAVGCWGASPAAAKLHAGQYLRRFEELEPALFLYHQAQELSEEGVTPGIDPAIAAAIVERLDSRWPLWAPCIMHHLVFGDPSAKLVRRLKQKIRGVLKQKTLGEDDRAFLERMVKDSGKIRRLKSLARLADLPWPDVMAGELSTDTAMPDLEPPEEPESRPKKPRPRRPRPVDDRQLDLFEPT